MANAPITIKVPGKLMIAGEYAVLDQYQRLVVMAADKYLFATLQTSEENKLNLVNLDLPDLNWSFDEDIHIDSEDHRIRFVKEAMRVALTYAKEQDVTIPNFSLEIRSELDDISGAKYGLGSSAAAVVGTVSSILTYLLPEAPEAELVFKLASIANINVQQSGSGADIAASTYGGWLAYSSFQAEWLLEELAKKTQSLTRLVKRNWQYLKIEQLDFPENLHLCVGWTGSPASTTELVSQVRKIKHEKHADYAAFMVQSGTAVQGIIHGMKEQDAALILEGIQMNRQALKKLGEVAGVNIETADLTTLCNIAEENGGAAKPSGAGGGDCGIAIVSTAEQKEKVEAAWIAAGIQPLSIQPQKVGAKTL